MEIERLSLFMDVVRTGSFAAVARARSIAPSSVSRAIQSLEAELGVRLFHRTTRALSLTSSGEAYASRVEGIVEALDSAAHAARSEGQGPTGRLRVTTSAAFSERYVQPGLADFLARYPALQLDLIQSDQRLDLVADRVDLAVRHGHLEDSRFISSKLLDVSYHIYVAVERSGARPQTPEDLIGQDLLTYGFAPFADDWRCVSDDQVLRVDVTPRLRVSSASAMRAAVEAGLGFGILADWLADPLVKAGRIERVCKAWCVAPDDAQRSIWLVRPSRKFVPDKTRLFQAYLLQAVDKKRL
ncbi:LysR substrate-binding domain-containing protein [Maricaulis sp. D1M11]|uniref:LysR family transcriptional regulator n=1 Tax=Maricaulis sp. D1M11 TaxID=3076117 RepID=UPI0039B5FE64